MATIYFSLCKTDSTKQFLTMEMLSLQMLLSKCLLKYQHKPLGMENRV
jgi:hypothetical protein